MKAKKQRPRIGHELVTITRKHYSIRQSHRQKTKPNTIDRTINRQSKCDTLESHRELNFSLCVLNFQTFNALETQVIQNIY